ncbi:MAG: ABC transporter substrate-binding protein [Chloroflexi bacterium]|nr:ABC transporter substrate-binding protein [Chloroflexota bacterium]
MRDRTHHTAAVIGCGDDDDEVTAPVPTTAPTAAATATAAPTEAVKTGSIVIGRQNKSPSMDPNTTALAPTEYYAVYDPLTRLDITGTVIEPALAESWEAAGSDWIFSLREAEWSDGTEFTADDVKFSFEYYANPDNASRLISRVNTQESVTVVDPRTVRIRATGTDPIMPRRATLPYVLPKHVFEASGGTPTAFSEALATNPVGTGSYVVTNIVQDQSIEFAESASSWRGNRGYTAAKLNIIEEFTTLVAAYESGDLDWVQRVPATDVARVQALANTETGAPPSLGAQHWDFGNRRAEGGPTNDVRVRRALISAIDVELIIDAVFQGLGRRATDQIPSEAVFGFSPEKSSIDYDPDTARQLLADAGFPNGFEMPVDSRLAGDTKAFVEACTGFWSDIGVESAINPLEINIWRDRLYGREQRPWPGAFNAGWIAYLFDASFLYDWYEGAGAYRLWDGPEDPTAAQFDALYGAAIVELDDEGRRGLYQGINDLFAWDGEAPVGPTYHAENHNAWYTNRIADYVARAFPDLNFDEISPA